MTCTTCDQDYEYDDANDVCYFGVSCSSSGWQYSSSEACFDSGYENKTHCFFGEGCNAAGCQTQSEAMPPCDEGTMNGSQANCEIVDVEGSIDSCYYNSTDACAADNDGWDYGNDTTVGSLTCTNCGNAAGSGFEYDTATDLCYYNVQCTSSGWDDSNFVDCDNNDDSDGSDGQISGGEVLASTCTATCTGLSDCCNIEVLTCNSGNECVSSSSLWTYEDDVPSMTCYRSNAGSWIWGSPPASETDCNDGFDNDCDGKADGADVDDCQFSVDDDDAGADTVRDNSWDYYENDADAVCNNGINGDYGDLCMNDSWGPGRGVCANYTSATNGICVDLTNGFIIDDESTGTANLWDVGSNYYTSPPSGKNGHYCTGYNMTKINVPTFCADRATTWEQTDESQCADSTDDDSDGWTDEMFRWDASEGKCVECNSTGYSEETDFLSTAKNDLCESACGADSACDEQEINTCFDSDSSGQADEYCDSSCGFSACVEGCCDVSDG
ncbi:MAG: hypothetical protein D6698_15930, partial [Gammaproteobacteria bacterium]